MVRLFEYLGRQPKSLLVVLALVWIALVGAVDYATGPELASSAFYLPAIFLSGWFVGRRAALALAFVSAAVWLAADLASRLELPHPFLPWSPPAGLVPFWNAGVRLTFFLIVAYALSGLRAAQKMQEELIHFIVHDLRSPLSGILMGLRALPRTGGAPLEEPQKQLVGAALSSGERMLTMINSMLDLSRLEAGQMPLQLGAVSVQEILDDTAAQLALLAEQKQVRLERQLEPGAAGVWADRELTVRILANLVGNALKYSPAHAAVCVRAAPAPEAGAVTFSVTDHGPGIPRKWVDRVFGKFAQVEARKDGGAVGSGLGLTFCRAAVEAQGGRIAIASEEGKGTTVTFTVPVKPSER